MTFVDDCLVAIQRYIDDFFDTTDYKKKYRDLKNKERKRRQEEILKIKFLKAQIKRKRKKII